MPTPTKAPPKPAPQVSTAPPVHQSPLTQAQAQAMLQRAKEAARAHGPRPTQVPVVYVGLEAFVAQYGAMQSPMQTAGAYLDAQREAPRE